MKYTFVTLSLVAAFLPTVFGASVHRRTAICGSKGWDDGTDGYAYRSNGSYVGCSTACQHDPVHCKSFSYDGSNCNLYNVPVAGNFEKDSSSPFTFYDASCIAASSSTTSSSTSSKSSTTTTKISTFATSTRSNTASSITTSKVATTAAISTTKSTTKTVVTTIATTTITPSKASSSTTVSVSASASTPPCPLPTWTLHDFIFVNSTHNLDCAGADSTSDLCATGKDPQPSGYGPPDSVSVTINGGIGSCHQQNPGTVPLRSIGNNVVRCSGSSDQLEFYGDSNSASSVATFNINNPVYCDNGASYYAWATNVKTEMDCVYDAFKNATCTLKGGDVVVPATGFGGVVYPSTDSDSDES